MSSQIAQYRFGAFQVDPKRRELRRGPVEVDVQPKVLDVIVHLIESRDRVVPREELLDDLWGDASVSEGVLTTAIHAARTALNDSAARAWAIKTVARRGYRFVAPVVEGDTRPPNSIAETDGPDGLAPGVGGDFVGGEASLKRVTRAFQKATQGEGGILVVTGEAGQGKTRLLDEVQRRAQNWEALVATTACEGRKGTAAYSPWSTLIRKLAVQCERDESLRELGSGLDQIMSLFPDTLGDGSDGEDRAIESRAPARFRLVDNVGLYLSRLTARTPVLLMLDDLQGADQASLRLLSLLAPEIRHMSLLLIVTVRDYNGPPDGLLPETLAEIAHNYPGGRMTIEGLSKKDTGVLVAKLIGVEPSSDWVDTIAERSEGNPFFIREIVSLLQVENVQNSPLQASWVTQVPPAVRDVVLRRLSRLSLPCRDLLLQASVLGREWSLELLALFLGDEPAEFAERLTEATQMGFIREKIEETDRYQFVHGLLHDTLYGSLPMAQRQAFHRRAAEILDSDAVRAAERLPGVLADHYMRVGDDKASARASDWAEKAAQQAASLGAWDEAAKFYGMALDALDRMDQPDPARRCDFLIGLGGARLDARVADPRGRDSLIRAARIAQELDEPDALIRVALALASTSLQTGPRDREMIEVLSAAMAALGDHGTTSVRARLMAQLAYQRQGAKPEDGASNPHDVAVEMARESGDNRALFETLNLRCAAFSGPSQGERRVRDADELLRISSDQGLAEIGLFAYRWRLHTALEAGDMDAADRELAAYDAAVDRERLWSGRWYGLTVRAARAMAEARFGSAERMVMESFAHRRDETTPLVIGTFATQLFWLRREQGRVSEVQHLREHDSPHVAFRVLHMMIDAELGQPDRARDALKGAVETELMGLSVDYSYLYVLSALAETAVMVEDDGCARILYERMLPYAENYVNLFLGCLHLGSVSRFLGRLALTFGEPGMAGYHFAHAVDANRATGSHLWVAHTRLDWATALSGQGHAARVEARELLRPCLAESRERGIKAIAARSGKLLEDLRK